MKRDWITRATWTFGTTIDTHPTEGAAIAVQRTLLREGNALGKPLKVEVIYTPEKDEETTNVQQEIMDKGEMTVDFGILIIEQDPIECMLESLVDQMRKSFIGKVITVDGPQPTDGFPDQSYKGSLFKVVDFCFADGAFVVEQLCKFTYVDTDDPLALTDAWPRGDGPFKISPEKYIVRFVTPEEVFEMLKPCLATYNDRDWREFRRKGYTMTPPPILLKKYGMASVMEKNYKSKEYTT